MTNSWSIKMSYWTVFFWEILKQYISESTHDHQPPSVAEHWVNFSQARVPWYLSREASAAFIKFYFMSALNFNCSTVLQKKQPRCSKKKYKLKIVYSMHSNIPNQSNINTLRDIPTKNTPIFVPSNLHANIIANNRV